MNRRAFVVALGTAAVGGAAALAGCGSSGSDLADTVAGAVDPTAPPLATAAVVPLPSATPMAPPTATPAPAATPAPTGPPPFDPAKKWWLQRGFAPVPESTFTDLEITGALPPELNGLYVRNGSNPARGDSTHWFFGDGMVHGIRLAGGQASWYGNRYIQTPYIDQGLEFGELTQPGQTSSQSNVSVFAHGARLLTSGEVGWPFEISPTDLSTLGAYDYGGKLGAAMTAHPKTDPATGNLHFFGYGFFAPYLTYYVADPAGQLIFSEEIAVGASTMIHDFAITETDAIFWEMPVVFDLEAAIAGSDSPYTWDPDYGSRIGIMPLGGPTSAIRWVDIDVGYVFHGTNAHRDGDNVVLDVSRLDAVFDGGGLLRPSYLNRWTVDTSGADLTWSGTQLHDRELDFPEIDRRYLGRRHRHAWYVTSQPTEDGNLNFLGIVGMDASTGATSEWMPGPAIQPHEPQFVPAGADAGEGEGWLLCYTWDQATDLGGLAVLDATDLGAGPVATVHIPARVPFGFHGDWLPEV